MAEIDEKLAELEGFSDYIREYQVGLSEPRLQLFITLPRKQWLRLMRTRRTMLTT